MKFARPLSIVTYDVIVIRRGARDVEFPSCAVARNTENQLSGSESMPFVLHYSVQSNTASGIRVSRRAPPIEIPIYNGTRGTDTPLKGGVFISEHRKQNC